MKIALPTARRIAIRRHVLDGETPFASGKEGAAQIVERLGYVQIDTIAVVERAHHHTLWTRHREYAPDMLHALQAQDRRVFEGWSHAASYLPMRDYRYYRAEMRARARSPRGRQRLKEHGRLVKAVLERIRQEGPLGAADFEAPKGFPRGTWWNWKPAKQVLELLFAFGELMVTERRNFHRIYDLTERVLPPHVDLSEPTQDDLRRFTVLRELNADGIVPVPVLDWPQGNKEERRKVLEELAEEGKVVLADVTGMPCGVLPEALDDAERTSPGREARLLSPFDNLVIRRHWLKALFDFDYRIECYVPEPKRRYGYFSLPVLWNDRFVGRVDAKAERKARTLVVRHAAFEPEVKEFKELLPALGRELEAFAAFNGCKQVTVEKVTPTKAAKALGKALA